MTGYKNITWCTRDCENNGCFRNKKHIPTDVLKDNDIIIWQNNFSVCKNYEKPDDNQSEFEQESLF